MDGQKERLEGIVLAYETTQADSTASFYSNFIGEKRVLRVTMRPGVDVEVSKAQKDELLLLGNSLEDVSQSAADIQQICRVRNKDIRKVRVKISLLPLPSLAFTDESQSSLTVSMCLRRPTSCRASKSLPCKCETGALLRGYVRLFGFTQTLSQIHSRLCAF